ncbi:MAG: hypothetical protein LBC40_06500, partial [Dysgonamonadaceae bacterium]|nr:hypothetical protein [Dysgonamonadaceae bacterium]
MKAKFKVPMKVFLMVCAVCLFSACGDKDSTEDPSTPGTNPGGTVDTDFDVAVIYGDQAVGLEETSVAGVYAKTVDF